ncbi:MAG: hypothetical protein GAK36_00106 [Pseudomonas sp.]|nr:MAG: hypothetical protein GAK36_00106 [Pseudomonas sp.]
MKLFNSIRAWLAGQLVKGIAMTDENTVTDVTNAASGADLQGRLSIASTAVAPVVEAAPVSVAPTAIEPTELEKLEKLIEKLELTTVKEVKAAIGFIRALV